MEITNLIVSSKTKVRITCNVLIEKFFGKPTKYYVRGFLPTDHKSVEKEIEEPPEELPEDYESGKTKGYTISEKNLEPILAKAFARKEDWLTTGQSEFIKVEKCDLYIKKVKE